MCFQNFKTFETVMNNIKKRMNWNEQAWTFDTIRHGQIGYDRMIPRNLKI